MLTSAVIAVAEPALELVTKSLGPLPVAAHVLGRAQACLAMPLSTGHGGAVLTARANGSLPSASGCCADLVLARHSPPPLRSPTLRPMRSFVRQVCEVVSDDATDTVSMLTDTHRSYATTPSCTLALLPLLEGRPLSRRTCATQVEVVRSRLTAGHRRAVLAAGPQSAEPARQLNEDWTSLKSL